jgi:predicted nuclease of restriction endonuclease-like (RecB) superfamily
MTTRKQIMTVLKAQLEQLKDLQRDTFYYQDTIDKKDSDKFLQEQIDTLRSNIGKL